MTKMSVKRWQSTVLRRLFRLVNSDSSTSANVPVWVEQGELSAKGAELKYWEKTGLKKGKDFYAKYLELVGLTSAELQGLIVADFGCGPFGGVLSILPPARVAYPIDVLAEEYNRWGCCPYPILAFDGRTTILPANSCDRTFCLNTIDHTTRPEPIMAELWRILKPDGLLYLHLHLRQPDQLNKIHPFAWSEADVRRRFDSFELLKLQIHEWDWINDNDYRMLSAILQKPATAG